MPGISLDAIAFLRNCEVESRFSDNPSPATNLLATCYRLLLDETARHLTLNGVGTEAERIAQKLLKLGIAADVRGVRAILTPLHSSPDPTLMNAVYRAIDAAIAAASRKATIAASGMSADPHDADADDASERGRTAASANVGRPIDPPAVEAEPPPKAPAGANAGEGEPLTGAERDDTPQPYTQWLSLAEAHEISGINPGTISRSIDAGKIKSNGKKGRGRKVDSADFNRWQLERAKRPEQTESDGQVERLLENTKDEE